MPKYPFHQHGSELKRAGRSRILLVTRLVLAAAICLMSIAPILVPNIIENRIKPLSDDRIVKGHDETSESRWKASLPPGAHYGKRVITKTVRHLNKTEALDLQFGISNESDLFNYDYDLPNVSLPPDIGSSGRALLLNALRPRPVWDEEIDPAVEEERCNRYFTYQNGTLHPIGKYDKNRKRRRVFLGSLIADDSWHALGAIAMETYGIYTAVVFVESNRTQNESPRQRRFVKGALEHEILVESNLFGPNTTVHVGQFTNEAKVRGGGLIREHMQRNMILKLWKEAGMTEDDVGILSDADETPSRDFLRAIQICDIPQLDADTQNCHSPKLVVASSVFEGSPECMATTRKWMHPDLMLGKCIEGIGDGEFHLKPDQRVLNFAWRHENFTTKTNYIGWPKEKNTYPLWNAADFRRDLGGKLEIGESQMGNIAYTGFHFHNYFETIRQLRTKYKTYGHPVKNAEEISLSAIHYDLDSMVDCVLGRPTDDNMYSTLRTRLKQFDGRIPIAYQLKGYTISRHYELKKILMEDSIGHQLTWHDANSPNSTK